MPARSLLLTVLFVFGLAACASQPEQKLPELTFTHLTPINLAVTRIDTVNAYAPPAGKPHVEHQVPVAPATAVTRWAADRLRAVGARGTGKLTIVEASLVEDPLKVDKGLKGAFKKEQSERYTATIEAILELESDGGAQRGNATARVTHSTTVREDASLYDRERVQFELVEKLMVQFDVEMEKNIRAHLVNWMR
ncbi:MAG: hypothetical protein H6907_09190 [Hyphomicrobiales bacterium]|nr:hypothetical protein [Hyphomicrobiales bacterium]MCP5371892.1 hypothetical protein [Hyphomicrobiales bacterium]